MSDSSSDPPVEPETQNVIREEVARGRKKPYDSAYAKRRRQLKQRLKIVMESGDEQAFLHAITEYGLQPGSAEYERLLRVFRDAVEQQRTMPP